MKLYIIGNGFDLAHNLPTSYNNFRDWLIEKYPYASYNYRVPESIMYPDGGEVYDDNEVIGYIIEILDSCDEGEWNNLEAYLGSIAFDALSDELLDETFEKDTFREIYANEDISNNISIVFKRLKSLFEDWVYNELGNINYRGHYNAYISECLDRDGKYLSFNYTTTLECVYGVNGVCHIHGCADDKNCNIYFGHGNDDDFTTKSIGASDTFNSLKHFFRKNTSKAYFDNIYFFRDLKKIEEIYSYGFSFSDVDMFYINEIKKRINKKAIWYINEYDWDRKHEIVEKLGFKTERKEW